MTVRCKCGKYTNYGLTCSSCRVETIGSEKQKRKGPASEEETDDLPFDEEDDFIQYGYDELDEDDD